MLSEPFDIVSPSDRGIFCNGSRMKSALNFGQEWAKCFEIAFVDSTRTPLAVFFHVNITFCVLQFCDSENIGL